MDNRRWHTPGVTQRLLAVVAGMALGSTACNLGPDTSARDGRALDRSLCVACHGTDGRPPQAIASRLGARDLSAAEFRARVAKLGPGFVAQQVREGSKSKLMPSFAGVLDEAQINAVAAFVASPEFGQPDPAPPAAAAPPGARR